MALAEHDRGAGEGRPQPIRALGPHAQRQEAPAPDLGRRRGARREAGLLAVAAASAGASAPSRVSRLLLLPEERVEGGAGARLVRLGPAQAGLGEERDLAELEELAEVRLVLVRLPLGLGLEALVVGPGVVETAVEADLQVGVAVGAARGALDLRGEELELAAAVVAGLMARL